MTKIAVIKTGGKQYKVHEGQVLLIEKLDEKEGSNIKFDTLLTSKEDGADLSVGQPSLGEKTEAKVLGDEKGKKTNSTKYKNKIRYHKNFGHRQNYTRVEITSIK
ncbi:50S ribosomal protein L21 [bacterium]|nr:50S ribosomal protein L21 [bacterium]